MFNSTNRIVPIRDDDHNQNEDVNLDNNIGRNIGTSNSNTAIPVAFIDEDRPVYVDPNVLLVDTASLNTLPLATIHNDNSNDNVHNNSHRKDSHVITVEADATNIVTDLTLPLELHHKNNTPTNEAQLMISQSLPLAQGQLVSNNAMNRDSIAHAQAAYTITASRALSVENDTERMEEDRIRSLIQSFLLGSPASRNLQQNLSHLSPREQEILDNSNYNPEQQAELARLASQIRNNNNNNSPTNRSISDPHVISGINRLFAEESRENLPDDHFPLACISLICCCPCLPIALCSMYESYQVSTLHQRGHYLAAKIASTRAKLLAMIAIALGGIWWLIILGSEFEELS